MANALSEARPPSYKKFQLAVMRVVGRHTDCEFGKTVKLTQALREEIIGDAGFDPKNLPEAWVRGRRLKTPAGIDTNVATAYRFLHHHTHQGRHGNAWTVQAGRGQWGLSEKGVIEARKLLRLAGASSRRKPNQTSIWLHEHLRPEHGEAESALIRIMKAAVAKKCRVSCEMQIVDDHVQECLLRLIRRDSLRSRIEAGRKITPSHIATYAVRSAYTDIRDAGTEPITRVMLGARTQRERERLKEQSESGGQETLQVSFTGNGLVFDENKQFVDMRDAAPNASEVLADRRRFEQMWARLGEVLAESVPKAADRYLSVLKMQIVDGYTIKEIAAAENVSPVRANKMLAAARRVVRRAGIPALLLRTGTSPSRPRPPCGRTPSHGSTHGSST